MQYQADGRALPGRRPALELPALRLPQPYPDARAAAPNPAYAQMLLDNFGGGNSEMTAVASYLYANLALGEAQPEIARVFLQISEVEMVHLRLFGILAQQLGAEPRLWSRPCGMPVYWTPGYLTYPRGLPELLEAAVESELAAIAKYEMQAKTIRDAGVAAMLRRVILDEQRHVEIFRALRQAYV